MLFQIFEWWHHHAGDIWMVVTSWCLNGDIICGRSIRENPIRKTNYSFTASATHLSKLDSIQKMAERFSGCEFPSLHSYCKASAVGLLRKLLDSRERGPLQHFCPVIAIPPTHSYSLRSLNCDPLLLSSPVWYSSLDWFQRSFFGTIANIWASTPSSIRLRGYDEGWAVIRKLLQRHICV